jgi:hypothetical protein
VRRTTAGSNPVVGSRGVREAERSAENRAPLLVLVAQRIERLFPKQGHVCVFESRRGCFGRVGIGRPARLLPESWAKACVHVRLVSLPLKTWSRATSGGQTALKAVAVRKYEGSSPCGSAHAGVDELDTVATLSKWTSCGFESRRQCSCSCRRIGRAATLSRWSHCGFKSHQERVC